MILVVCRKAVDVRRQVYYVVGYPEAKELILNNTVEMVSCDSDLGTGFEQGKNLVSWLEEMTFTDDKFTPPTILIHTDNVVDREQMASAVANIQRFIANRNSYRNL